MSVVIPTYSRPDYLRLTLASVAAQTYRDLEIIVEDNASPQHLARLFAEFGDEKDPLLSRPLPASGHQEARALGDESDTVPAARPGPSKCKLIRPEEDP